MRPIDKLLPRLEKVKQTASDRWIARCPAHEDKHPSFGVREKDDGTLLLCCRAGCSNVEIIESLGLSFSDLYPDEMKPAKPGNAYQSRVFFKENVFKDIRLEASVVALIGSDMHKKREITQENYKRLMVAVERLERIQEDCYGRR